jgi:hypothetical protein
MPQDNLLDSLVTVPNSLKVQLDRAQNLLAQSEHAEAGGDHSLAIVKAREAMQAVRSFAQQSPELAVLVLGGEMGFRGYQIETVEQVDRYQVVERKFLGMCLGSEVVNVPTVTRRTVRAHFL